MQLIPPRVLAEQERDLGVYVFALIRHWAGWVHRRVETLRFKDAETFLRRTSVDFTLPELPTPLHDAAGNPIHCVPLALLTKRPQRGFDVRDETGKAVPVYSRAQNGPVSAAVLWVAAQALVGKARPDLGPLPAGLADDFWHIAHRSPRAAQRVWESLSRARSDEETEWRDALVLDDLFMQLARDLSGSFLVLVHVAGASPGDRRVLKFSYEEQRTPKTPIAPAAGTLRRNHELGPEGQGRIAVSARTVVYDAEGKAEAPKPEAGLEIRIWRCNETGARTGDYGRLLTNKDGTAVDGFPVGRWEVEEMVPPGLMESTDRVVEVTLEASQTKSVSFELKQVANRASGLEPDRTRRDEKRIRRGLGWYSLPIPINVPAVGSCASYHFECEAPEEMAISLGTLSAAGSYVELADMDRDEVHRGDAPVRQNVDRGPVQRAHLHLDVVPQGHRGVAFLRLRSLPATILRPALISSTATTLILLVVAARFPHLSTNVGSVAAALLFVPGLLTAYVVRPREHPMSTSLLFGHRLMAVTSSVCALAAAMTLLVERTWATGSRGGVMLEPSWTYTHRLLWTLFGVSAVSVLLIFVALRLSLRPPESRQRPRPARRLRSWRSTFE